MLVFSCLFSSTFYLAVGWLVGREDNRLLAVEGLGYIDTFDCVADVAGVLQENQIQAPASQRFLIFPSCGLPSCTGFVCGMDVLDGSYKRTVQIRPLDDARA